MTKGRKFFRAAALSSVGLELGVATVLGWGVGYWLDQRLGSGPWLMIVFLLFGVAAGFKGVYEAARKAQKAIEDDGR